MVEEKWMIVLCNIENIWVRLVYWRLVKIKWEINNCESSGDMDYSRALLLVDIFSNNFKLYNM